MLLYTSLILVPIILTPVELLSKKLYTFLSLFLIWIVIAFRALTVGSDTLTYAQLYGQLAAQNLSGSSLLELVNGHFELGYVLLNKFLYVITPNPRILLIFAATIEMIAIGYFINKFSTSQSLSIILFITMNFLAFSMNALRQCLALTLVVLAVAFLIENNDWMYLVMVIGASFFHKTALIMLILYPIWKMKLTKKLDEFAEQTDLLRLLPQAHNQGLGKALAIGVEACWFDLIARMDTDDIAKPQRLAEQLAAFQADPELMICGTNIAEFDGSTANIIGKRHLPADDAAIRNFSKRRNPFNHMTVMFKRQAVLDAGNYQPLSGFKDYYLWVRVLKNGGHSQNLQADLVDARTGADMYARRGGMKYLLPGIKGRWAIYRAGLGKLSDWLFVTLVHIVVSLMPNRLRGWFYETKLRG
ncbi:EpsG family protein [Levilactobacillus brevis]|uniref:EpsG family protein n=1 Tax=Levilactobacillus brevis TaxID=1580 RepID=UPI003260BB51